MLVLICRNLAKIETYAYRHAYGQNRSESDDDDYTKEIKDKLILMTPNTRRDFKNKIDEEQTGKIGPAGAFFTLLKGFVASGVLFLPKGFVTGGWLFSSITLFLSGVFTIVCSYLLIDIRKKYKLSFSEIGYKAYGLPGKIAVDFFLAFTQTIFVCAYIAFISNSVNGILTALFDFQISKWIIGGV